MSSQPASQAVTGTVAHASPKAAATACGCCPADLPDRLLEVHVELPGTIASVERGRIVGTRTARAIPTSTVGVGYELRSWRAAALAKHIVEWAPDFALRDSERRTITPGRMVARLRRALVATFGNGRDRGVAAEILLHAVLRDFYGSSTLVHKIYFKTADNDTVKGFDAVHSVHTTDGTLELWLGEAKFYRRISDALRVAAADLENHLTAGYLRSEFAIVADKIEDTHPHADEIRDLIRPNRRIDEIYTRIVVPVFVTYDSDASYHHDDNCPEYIAALKTETESSQADLAARLDVIRHALRQAGDPMADFPLEVRLFLLPMAGKTELLEALERETAWVR